MGKWVDPWSSLVSQSSRIDESYVQRETLTQNLRWKVIEEDTQGQHLASMLTYTSVPPHRERQIQMLTTHSLAHKADRIG